MSGPEIWMSATRFSDPLYHSSLPVRPAFRRRTGSQTHIHHSSRNQTRRVTLHSLMHCSHVETGRPTFQQYMLGCVRAGKRMSATLVKVPSARRPALCVAHGWLPPFSEQTLLPARVGQARCDTNRDYVACISVQIRLHS